jgi:hypothetical protein
MAGQRDISPSSASILGMAMAPPGKSVRMVDIVKDWMTHVRMPALGSTTIQVGFAGKQLDIRAE